MGKNSIQGHGHKSYGHRNNNRVPRENLAQRMKANRAGQGQRVTSVPVDNLKVASPVVSDTPSMTIHEKINARAQAPSQFGGKSVYIPNQQRWVSWSADQVQAHAGAVNQPPVVNYMRMNPEQRAYYEALKGKPSAQLTNAEKKWLSDVKNMGREIAAANQAEQQEISKAIQNAKKEAKNVAKRKASTLIKMQNKLKNAENQANALARKNGTSTSALSKFFKNPRVRTGGIIGALALAGLATIMIANNKEVSTTTQQNAETTTNTTPTDTTTTVVENQNDIVPSDTTKTNNDTPHEETLKDPEIEETDNGEFATGTTFSLEDGKYTVVKGDNLWNMSKAYLTDQNAGKVPTDTEILTQVYLLMKKNPELKWEEDNSGVVLIYEGQKINFEG